LRTVLLRTGHGGRDAKFPQDRPDYTASDLAEAVSWILEGHPTVTRDLMAVTMAAATARLVLIGGPARSGKSSIAQALKEQLHDTGRRVHVICSDGWLMPTSAHVKQQGLLARCDFAAMEAAIVPLVGSNGRRTLDVPRFDGDIGAATGTHTESIGPGDLLILEGVSVLFSPTLRAAAKLRLYVDCDASKRSARLRDDYSSRRPEPANLEQLLWDIEQNELPRSQAGASFATHKFWNQ
jgi:uridine kinase